MSIATASTAISLLTDLDVARGYYDCGAFADSVHAAQMIYEGADDDELKFRAILLWSSGESEQRHYKSALKALHLADPLLDTAKPKWKANYYCQRGYLKARLNRDPQVSDSGVIDYEESLFYARQANDPRVESRARNNLAARYSKAGRFEEAISEVSIAIQIAELLEEYTELGRYYDHKAQILIEHRHYAEALKYSEEALRLLDDHPSLVEARTTHGRALVALGSQYLEQPDPIDTFIGKRTAEKYLSVSLDANLLRLALDRANGNLLHAAEILQVKHPSLLQAVKRFNLSRRPVRRRGKSLLQK